MMKEIYKPICCHVACGVTSNENLGNNFLS